MVSNPTIKRDQIAVVLTRALKFLAKDTAPEVVRSNFIVLKEWELDSEHGVELACDLSMELGISIPEEDNPLIDEISQVGRKRARTFEEVVDYIAALCQN
jgi:acyl carrier protein